MKRIKMAVAALMIAATGCKHRAFINGPALANFTGTYKAGGVTLTLNQKPDGSLTGTWKDSAEFSFSGQAQGENFSGFATSTTCADAIVISGARETERSFFLTQVSGCGRKPLEQPFYK